MGKAHSTTDTSDEHTARNAITLASLVILEDVVATEAHLEKSAQTRMLLREAHEKISGLLRRSNLYACWHHPHDDILRESVARITRGLDSGHSTSRWRHTTRDAGSSGHVRWSWSSSSFSSTMDGWYKTGSILLSRFCTANPHLNHPHNMQASSSTSHHGLLACPPPPHMVAGHRHWLADPQTSSPRLDMRLIRNTFLQALVHLVSFPILHACGAK